MLRFPNPFAVPVLLGGAIVQCVLDPAFIAAGAAIALTYWGLRRHVFTRSRWGSDDEDLCMFITFFTSPFTGAAGMVALKYFCPHI